jgi:uncharacterized membrane protein YdjX (TVP38/TMEM64 family)
VADRPADHGGDHGWASLALSVVTVAIAAAVVLAIPDLRDAAGHALHGEGNELRRQLRDMGALGVFVLVALMLIHAVVFFPSELVTATAGYVYGFAGGVALAVVGWLASALLTYWLGRHAGRPVLRRLAGGHRLEGLEAALARGGPVVLLAARLLPVVPYSLIGYVAGAARVPLWTFVWTSVVGMLPLTLIVVTLGTRLQDFSWSDPVVWLALVPLLLAAVMARPLSRRLRV